MLRLRMNWLYILSASCAMFASIALISASLFSLKSVTDAAPKQRIYPATELVGMLGVIPRRLEFDRISIDLPCEREELDRYISCVAAPGPTEFGSPSRSRRLHSGRLVADSGNTPEWIIERNSPLVDHVKLRAEDFVISWRGLEAVSTSSGDRSEHRDQTLSALADLGVDLNSTIETKEGTLRVADLLIGSLGEFHLGQKEISWTASAYASYLPPQTVWWNRYGEEFSFDALAAEMMSRRLDQESCRGLHLVMVLTKILVVDRQSFILAPATRERLNAYVREKSAEAVESQLEDGSWPLIWSRSGFSGVLEYTPEASNADRVLVTGHLLEWFQMLPKDLKPSVGVAQAGSLWVLENLRTTPEETINQEFCPYTHAVHSLFVARFPVENPRGK